MNRAIYLTGLSKMLFSQYIKVIVFLHFSWKVVTGRMAARGFLGFLRRLLYFLSKMKENKFVTSGGTTKINLYVPGFPSKAFFKACTKVSTVGVKQPCISVLLSVTSACTFRCEHCYQKQDKGKDVPLEYLIDIVQKLDAMGVAFFNIEGGDPFLTYDRLRAVCEAVNTGEIWVNSTGNGITVGRLLELKKLNVKGVMFSLHAANERGVNAFMGRDNAWETMQNGIAACHEAGVDVAFNSCLLKDAFYDGTFQHIMNVAKTHGATIIQLIKPKPSGGWLGNDIELFTQGDLDHIEELVLEYNNDPAYNAYPFISAQIVDEKTEMFGCTAGGTDRFYINAKGDVQPCEFLNISFGNVMQEPFEDIYQKMRETFDIPGDRWLCETCAPDIYALHNASGNGPLPLTPEQSSQIYKYWDRGVCPDFYNFADRKYRTSKPNEEK